MRVGMFVDFMGADDKTPEDEYSEIEEMIRLATGKSPEFKREFRPDMMDNEQLDVYVFDWGGLLPGCDDLTNSFLRELRKQIDDHPNTLFIIWSSFTGDMYLNLLRQEAGMRDIEMQHNVVVANGMDDDVEARLKEIEG